MDEFTTLPSQTTTEKPKRHMISSSLFTSPMSPTSTLDTKTFSVLNGKKNPFPSEPPNDTTKTQKRQWTKGIGLAIVDALNDEKRPGDDEPDDPKRPNKPETRMILFGSHLKIQIPALQDPIFYSSDSPKPADFGLRTRNSHLGFFSARSPGPGSARFSGSISVTEMELSEDYTCVITHGPNPKTTHIFDNCVVFESMKVDTNNSYNNNNNNINVNSSNNNNNNNNIKGININVGFPSKDFLSFCFTCKRNLGQDKDIYMYRGEKAFCSQECRYEEMMLEESESQAKPKIKLESK